MKTLLYAIVIRMVTERTKIDLLTVFELEHVPRSVFDV